MPIKPELVALHKQSLKNQEKVLQVKDCCCFDCTKFFASSEVIDWIDDGDHKTAVCPHCGFDTVIPIDPNKPISEELLKKIQEVYIGDVDSSDVYPDFASMAKAWNQSQG